MNLRERNLRERLGWLLYEKLALSTHEEGLDAADAVLDEFDVRHWPET